MKIMREVIKYLLSLGGKVVFDLLPGKDRGTVTILTLHSVRENPLGMPTILCKELFEALISELARRYEVVSLSEVLDNLGSKTGNGRGPLVAITFDDGYLDNLISALPILEKHSVPATVFVTTASLRMGILHWDRLDNAIKETQKERLDLSSLGLGEYLLSNNADRKACIMELHARLKLATEEECRALIDLIVETLGAVDKRMMLDEASLAKIASSPCITIGSHTVNHAILTRVSEEQVEVELAESKRYLEELIKKPVTLFAYPNGNYDITVIRLLRKHGYTAACTTEVGVNNAATDPFRLQRVDVTAGALQGPTGVFSPVMCFAMVRLVIPRLKAALGR